MITPAFSISGTEYTRLNGTTFVYVWWRKDICLYVGMTERGFSRFRQHQTIGAKLEVRPDDRFDFYPCKDGQQCAELEIALTMKLMPAYSLVARRSPEMRVRIMESLLKDKLIGKLRFRNAIARYIVENVAGD